MMGREKRAQLLVPSFVFVAAAAAAACGGSSLGDAGAGGATVSTNPPEVSYGGATVSTNPPPIGWGGYGSGGNGNEAGTPINPPPLMVACPATVPANGSACLPVVKSSNRCVYGSGDACSTTMAWCEGGVWSLGGYAVSCPGNGGAGGGAPIGEGGAGGDGPAPDPVVYCPEAVPKPGEYCYKPSTVTSYRCDYVDGCGTYEATCSGQWQLQAHGSPADCAGGAAGN